MSHANDPEPYHQVEDPDPDRHDRGEPVWDEATREAVLDRRVQHRLATDNAYRYAENAEEQAVREEEIEREEDERLAPAK